MYINSWKEIKISEAKSYLLFLLYYKHHAKHCLILIICYDVLKQIHMVPITPIIKWVALQFFKEISILFDSIFNDGLSLQAIRHI